MNNVKVFGLMAGLTALFVMAGGALGGQGGMMIALLMAAAMNFFAYFASAKMVLRMYNAQVVTAAEAPELYEMVDRLRQRAALPMPTVAIAPHMQPNAFATGRNPEHAVVCVTEGILQLVSRDELEGVIAHELAHIKNRDMLLQTFTATIAGAISSLGQMWMWSAIFGGSDDEEGGSPVGALLMMVLAPIAAGIIQMAISRQREFKADLVGAQICGRPLSLAHALRKLEAGAERIPMHVSPSAAPLAQVNPLSSMHGGGFSKLFSTHPPTEERVARLEAMARG
ncbi:MAG: Peptidase M48, Ste24p precursor [uncultured Gemmatimonadetes bacterium]|uniref:Protease HtpX homolog n=1 Tax=uncultured Gemmatimonadota bacterium TaxID=203437 RepID=A0A6J4KGY2_9BACT|nr:MAG: Peptidase M48, Ste24p precursor [uncultured Gemmatimonadota bacterium]